MSENDEISETIIRKNKEITRKFLMSIDESTELLDKEEKFSENPELKELNNGVKSFFSTLDKEGFFKNDNVRDKIQLKILETLNKSDNKLAKLVKSDEFSFAFDLVKPFLFDLFKKIKEKGTENS